ncbi:MAG: hypothetical protein HWE25_06505 [Alphaproteobacteria bacterium]|nr:hypothetical protein [Alphaproteobacteria bacterium]
MLTTLVLWLQPAPAKADGEAPKQLRAAVGVLAPYAFATPEEGGLLPDAFGLLSARLGESIRLSRVTYRRMTFMMENGDVDMAIMVRSPQSEKIALPIVRMALSPLIVVGLKGTEIQSPEAAKALRLAAMRGGRFDIFEKAGEFEKMLFTHDYVLAAKMLRGGRIDAIGGPAEGVLRALQDEGFGAPDIGNVFVMDQLEVWLHVSRRSKLFADHKVIALSAQAMVDDGTYGAIRQRYLASDLLEKMYGPLLEVPKN